MRPPPKVVVDECVGSESRLFEAFRAWLGDHAAEFLSLSEAHPGIPDVEILDKLLGPSVVLLTNHRVLHNRDCEANTINRYRVFGRDNGSGTPLCLIQINALLRFWRENVS